MLAIRTTYLSPTNNKPSRIKAKAWSGSVSVSWDHGLNTEDNHRVAAHSLAAKIGWFSPNLDGYDRLVTGCLADGSYCHVLTGRKS